MRCDGVALMVEAGEVTEELTDARQDDEVAFELLVEQHRRELYAHCYRMLGSVQNAEDASRSRC